jgi:hypothetical protein
LIDGPAAGEAANQQQALGDATMSRVALLVLMPACWMP